MGSANEEVLIAHGDLVVVVSQRKTVGSADDGMIFVNITQAFIREHRALALLSEGRLSRLQVNAILIDAEGLADHGGLHHDKYVNFVL